MAMQLTRRTKLPRKIAVKMVKVIKLRETEMAFSNMEVLFVAQTCTYCAVLRIRTRRTVRDYLLSLIERVISGAQ